MKRSNRLVLASLILLSVCFGAQSNPPVKIRKSAATQKVAVVVGIAGYPSLFGWRTLHYSELDAKKVASALNDQGYTVFELIGGNATGNGIREAIKRASKILGPKDGTLLFFFSGHGFSDTKAEMNYLAPVDSRIVYEPDQIKDGLAIAEVEDLMRATGASHRMLWLDACRNDPTEAAKGMDSIALGLTSLGAANGTLILYAASAGKRSWEDPELEHGVFTFFLLQAIQGEAAGSDGLLTFRRIASYVGERVKTFSIPRNKEQIPVWFGESNMDFIIGKARVSPSQGLRQVVSAEVPGSKSEARDAPNLTQDPKTRFDRLKGWASDLDRKYEAENKYDNSTFGLSVRTPTALINAKAEIDSAERDLKIGKDRSASGHLDEAEKFLQKAQTDFGPAGAN